MNVVVGNSSSASGQQNDFCQRDQLVRGQVGEEGNAGELPGSAEHIGARRVGRHWVPGYRALALDDELLPPGG